MNEFNLSKKQRDEISVDDLAMLVLRILQRNHKATNGGGGSNISYYPYSLAAILQFEIFNRLEPFEGVGSPFRSKFAEATNLLKQACYIMQDHTQANSQDAQRPTSKGLEIDTNAPAFGVTTPKQFLSRVEERSGSLDEVAKLYLQESYSAAENKLWLSSIFMLGAASERLIYVLSDHIDRLLADPIQHSRLNNITNVRQRKEWIVQQLPVLKTRLPSHRNAFTDVEDKFDSLYNPYRYLRNEAGHPRDSPPAIDPEQVKAMLFSFGIYAQAVNTIAAIP